MGCLLQRTRWGDQCLDVVACECSIDSAGSDAVLGGNLGLFDPANGYCGLERLLWVY